MQVRVCLARQHLGSYKMRLNKYEKFTLSIFYNIISGYREKRIKTIKQDTTAIENHSDFLSLLHPLGYWKELLPLNVKRENK